MDLSDPGQAPSRTLLSFQRPLPVRRGTPSRAGAVWARPARFYSRSPVQAPEDSNGPQNLAGRPWPVRAPAPRSDPAGPLRRARAAGGAACRPAARPVELARRQVEVGRLEHLAVEPDRPLLDQAPRLARAEAELVRDQRRQVDRLAVGSEPASSDLVGHLALRRGPVEALLGGRAGVLAMEALDESPGQLALRLARCASGSSCAGPAAAGSTRPSPRRGRSSASRTSRPAGR